jgi:formate hydrogenlyase subunit 3/multisubunit Na+/H+ antiporter MnhD subunit
LLGERDSRAVAPVALLVNGGVIGVALVASPFLASLFLELAGVAVLFMLPARTAAAVTLSREAIAGAKYLTLTVVSALALLAAFALIETTRTSGETRTLAQVVVALLVIGMGLRLAAFPFHVWLPDLAAVAPPPAIALATGVVNVAAVILLLSTLSESPWLVLPERNRQILAAGGTLGALGGAVLALNARDLRRLVAYGASAELGFVWVGISLGSGTSVAAAISLVVANVVSVLLFWTLITQLERRVGTTDLGTVRGLIAQLPGTALGFLAAALTAGGIPLFAAFPGRWILYRLGADGNLAVALGLALANLMLLFAFLRAFRLLFLGRPPLEVVPREAPGATGSLLLLTAVSLALGMAPWLLFEPIRAAVASLAFLQ